MAEGARLESVYTARYPGFESLSLRHTPSSLTTVLLPFFPTMTTLTVTVRGQVTFRKDVLQHLGIRPGEKIELDKLPDGRVTLKAVRPTGKIDGFLGLLAKKTKKVATLDEINGAAAAGWTGQE